MSKQTATAAKLIALVHALSLTGGCAETVRSTPTALGVGPPAIPRHSWTPGQGRQFVDECSSSMRTKDGAGRTEGQIRYACECISWNLQDYYILDEVDSSRVLAIRALCMNKLSAESTTDPRYGQPPPAEKHPSPKTARFSVADSAPCPEIAAPADGQKLEGVAAATARKDAAEAAWNAALAASDFATQECARLELDTARKAEGAEKEKADAAQRAVAIEAYIASHRLSPERQANLRKKEIVLGMTSEEVLLIYGAPNKVNRTVGRWGVHEQWVYDDEILYIENGKVTSWQD